jgi:uncharacterized protein (TIGR03437 family)
VSIPTNLTGSPNGTLTVPINVSDTTGKNALSYDAVLTFNPAALRLQNPPFDRTGTLSANLNVTTNSPTAGRLNISGFSSSPLYGAGVLLNLKFDVIGSLNSCSDLNWTSFRFNEGTPCSTASNGRACATGGGSIAGAVSFCASSPPKPVPGVTITAAGSPQGSATTDNSGNYQLPNLGGGPYTLTPAKTGDANGITNPDNKTGDLEVPAAHAHLRELERQSDRAELRRGLDGRIDRQLDAGRRKQLAGGRELEQAARAQPGAGSDLVASFGTAMATRVEVANTLPLPTTLAGTTVRVRDSAGVERLASLFFVAPTQINFQIPPGTAAGQATITVTSGDGTVSGGVANIAAVAPGFFTANASGQGVAAATVLRVKADGTQVFEPVARFDAAQNRFVAAPIDLGPENEQVFLILFGTGFRQRSSLSATSLSIGGVNVEVLYAGAQGDFVGLDQVNARLLRGLIGRGEIDVRLTANGQTANIVGISIK